MNHKSSCAIVLDVTLFLVFLLAVLHGTISPVPTSTGISVGSALWKGRTFKVLLQGFIILSGVVSILLILHNNRSVEEP